LRETPTIRALITVSIRKGLIYLMLGEKEIYSDPGQKLSEKIHNDSSVTDLSLVVYFHSNIINNNNYQGISYGHT